MPALKTVIDSFRGQKYLEPWWPLGDRALEEYCQMLAKQDEQYKELISLREKLKVSHGALSAT